MLQSATQLRVYFVRIGILCENRYSCEQTNFGNPCEKHRVSCEKSSNAGVAFKCVTCSEFY